MVIKGGLEMMKCDRLFTGNVIVGEIVVVISRLKKKRTNKMD